MSKTVRLLFQLNHWLDRTSFHGLNKVSRTSSKPIILAWLLLFAITFTYGMLLISSSFSLYFSHKTETSIKFIQKDRLTFPTVTVCNLEMYNSASDRFVIREQLRRHLNRTLSYTNREFELGTYFKVGENFYQTLPYLNNLTSGEIRNLSYDISEMLISCEFNMVSCGVGDFKEIWNYHYGLCYQFNANKSKISKCFVVFLVVL